MTTMRSTLKHSEEQQGACVVFNNKVVMDFRNYSGGRGSSVPSVSGLHMFIFEKKNG